MSSGSVVDAVEEALQARLMGSSEFDSGVTILNKVLNLQFRIYYNIANNKKKSHNNEIYDVLLKESEILEISLDQSVTLINNPSYFNLIINILKNCKALIYFHQNKLKEALSLFNKKINPRDIDGNEGNNSNTNDNGSTRDFLLLLDLESFYFKSRINNDKSSNVDEFLTILNHIPHHLLSKGYIFNYLSLISDLFDLKINNILDEKKIKPKSVPLLLLLFILNNKITPKQLSAHENSLLKYSTMIVNGTTFPKADENNNYLLEQVHFVLQFFFNKVNKLDNFQYEPSWKNVMISSMGKTFQSIQIAKTSMIHFMSIDENNESILNFNNVIKYSKKEYELNDNNYRDQISLIDSYNFILSNSKKNNSIPHIFDFNEINSELLNHLQRFYDKYNLKNFNNSEYKNESLNFHSNMVAITLPNIISQIFLKSWKILFDICSKDLLSLQSNQLTVFLCNSMALIDATRSNDKETLELYFRYAYTLAQRRQIENSIAFLEDFILNKNPLFYKAWHLLALCKSIQEDKQDSYKIVCSALESMINGNDDGIENEIKMNRNINSNEDKWQLINMKITQIYLVDDIFGTGESIEVLPELFELFNEMYDNDKDGSGEFGVDKRKLTRSKDFLLQTIWLLAAELYMKLYDEKKSYSDDNEELDDLIKQAREAIKEAYSIKTTFRNVNCNIMNGYLYMMKNDLKNALHEFDKALYYDDMNVDALLGLAELIFPSAENDALEDYLPLLSLEHDNINGNSKNTANITIQSVFANDTDKSAAYARLKLLLECSILKSVDAYYSADIWWYLSLIYEKYQDKEYKESLLTCIRNKEATPIRSFKYCKY